jgi:pimeloyl-ACP methyl ester carboxylesterase
VPKIQVGEVELFYELDHEGVEPVLMLVAGLGGQLTSWDEGFCDDLRQAGFNLLRFDNRDTGLSSSFDSWGKASMDVPPDGLALSADKAPYTLLDMADDAAGLLGALRIAAVHVLGVSMGGMIAQQIAISHPERVLTLCSIMSTTGNWQVGLPTPEAMEALLATPPSDRAGYVDAQVEVWKVIGSPGFPFDEKRIRDKAEAAYDRSFRPDGVGRQLSAILASPERTEALGKLRMPTLVIHGEGDSLVTPSGGVATHEAIPGSKLLMIPGMGHDLPPEVWEEVVAAVVENAQIAEPGKLAAK